MSLIESGDILNKLCSNDYYRGDNVKCAIQCLAEGKTIGRVRTLDDVGKTVIDEKLKDELMKSKDKWDVPDNMKWLLPLLLFPFASTPPRREITATANVNGKSVNISYDPNDPEAVKAAEAWREALFANGMRNECKEPVAARPGDSVKFDNPSNQLKDRLESAVKKFCQDMQKYTDKMASAMEPWTPVKTAEPKRDIMAIAGSAFELLEASKPLLAYLDRYGCDEYTGVTVSRDAAIVGMNPSNGGVLFSTHFPRNGESIKRRLTKLQGGQFWCMLSKEAMDAWADIAREYGKLSNDQKDGTDSVSICADFVRAVRHLSDRLTRDLDEASKVACDG